MKSPRTLSALMVVFILLTACGRKAPPRLTVSEKPAAPSSLTAVHREGAVLLAWDYSRSKLQYVREFKVMRSGGILAVTRETVYRDITIKSGDSYEYSVIAVGTGGMASDASSSVVIDVSAVPAAPSNLVAEVVDEGVRLLWSHTGDEVLFNVYRSPERALNPLLPANPEPLEDNSYTDIPYADRTAYYTVRALTGGPARHEGATSEVVEVRPEAFVPSAPSDVRATVAGDKVLIAWTDNPEAWVRSYTVYRSVDGENFTLIGETRTPSYLDSEGLRGDIYYKVRAMGPALEGDFSTTVAVKAE